MIRRRAFGCVLLAGCACLLGGCSAQRPAEPHRLAWPQMGTIAAVTVRGSAEEAERVRIIVRDVFERVEQALSAWRADSELSQLKACAESEILTRASAWTLPCYRAAFALRDQTQGLFNPRWRGPGTFDLGAIAKGSAVDLAYDALEKAGAHPETLIDLGGNLRAAGGTWKTGVRDPHAAAQCSQTFMLHAGEAVATSGTYARGKHIRDGRTGRAPEKSPEAVTVIHADSAMWADGLSTTLFLLGRSAGDDFLRTHHPLARALW